MRSDDELVRHYRERRSELDSTDGTRWYLFIKELRVENGCSLERAHQIALADPAWRRWLEQQINANPQCRKSALWYIRHGGDPALIEQVGDRLRVR